MSLSKQELIESVARQRAKKTEGGTLATSGLPHYTKPRAWAAIRAHNGLMLVSHTNGGYAVGRGIRLGCEFPPHAVLFDSKDAANNFFTQQKGD